MKPPTIKSLAKLMLMPLDQAERRFQKMGDYVLHVDETHRPFSACFYSQGIEVLICKASRFRLPDEKIDNNSYRVNAVLLKTPQYCRDISADFSPYTGKFYKNVAYSDSREEVRRKLGPPEYSYDPARYDEYPLTSDCAFQIVYRRGFEEVSYGCIVTTWEISRAMGNTKD